MIVSYIKTLAKRISDRNPVLFTAIVLCMIASMVGILYAFNFCNKVAQGNMSGEYVVDVPGDYSEQVAKIKNLNVDDCYKIIFYCEDDAVRIIYKGSSEILAGKPIRKKNEILLGRESESKLGETVEIDEREYRVAGITGDFDGVTFDGDYLPNGNFKTDRISVIARQNDKIVGKRLAEAFGQENVIFPQTVTLLSVVGSPIVIFLIAMGVFSVICMVVALQYVYSQNTDLMITYSNIGVKRGNLVAISLLTIEIIIGSAYIPAAMIYAIFERIWFRSGVFFGMTLTSSVSFGQYLVILLIMLLVFGLAMLPFFRKLSKKIERGDV